MGEVNDGKQNEPKRIYAVDDYYRMSPPTIESAVVVNVDGSVITYCGNGGRVFNLDGKILKPENPENVTWRLGYAISLSRNDAINAYVSSSKKAITEIDTTADSFMNRANVLKRISNSMRDQISQAEALREPVE